VRGRGVGEDPPLRAAHPCLGRRRRRQGRGINLNPNVRLVPVDVLEVEGAPAHTRPGDLVHGGAEIVFEVPRGAPGEPRAPGAGKKTPHTDDEVGGAANAVPWLRNSRCQCPMPMPGGIDPDPPAARHPPTLRSHIQRRRKGEDVGPPAADPGGARGGRRVDVPGAPRPAPVAREPTPPPPRGGRLARG